VHLRRRWIADFRILGGVSSSVTDHRDENRRGIDAAERSQFRQREEAKLELQRKKHPN
jgi:hypothetical protein